MTKVKTFDHIFEEVEFGYKLDTINLNAINNSTLNEVNFWRKIVEFYYKVFRDLLNTLFRRNGNMKRFFTFFVKLSKISSTNYFQHAMDQIDEGYHETFRLLSSIFYSCMSDAKFSNARI